MADSIQSTGPASAPAAANLPPSGHAPLEWRALKAELAPSQDQSRRLVRAILAFHEAWAKILFDEEESGVVSPARTAVRLLRREPVQDESAFVPTAFRVVYEDDAEGRYADRRAALDALAARFRAEFADLLEPGQRGAFDAFADRPLWFLDVGYWPHFQRLGELYWSEACLENDGHDNAALAMLGPGAPDIPKAERLKGRFCPRPFDYAQVDPDGHVFGCCPSMLFKSFGNLRTQDFMEAWNSETAMAVRASILDGSYRYCSARACPDIQGDRLSRNEAVTDPEHRSYIANKTTRLPRGPRQINLAYDQTCNLKCPSCRSGMIIARGEVAERLQEIHDVVLGTHLGDAQRLIITGSGDPFASRFYLDFLQNFDPRRAPKLRIQLSTNGLLLNERMWDSICNEIVDRIDLSVDAATPATYKANRGGNFDKLCRNLDFIGGLRRAGKISSFQMLFVVQANNFAEMPAFVRLGLRVHADRIVFKQLQNWGSWPVAGYRARAVQDPGHPEHGAFRESLRSPELHHPKADLFDLQHLIPEDATTRPGAARLSAPAPAFAHRLAEALLRDLGGETPLTRLVRQHGEISAGALLAEAESRACHPEGALVAPEDTEALVALLAAAEPEGAPTGTEECPAARLVASAVAALKEDRAPTALDWLRFRKHLRLDDRQAVLAYGLLRQLKADTAALVRTPDRAGGAPPLALLAGGGEGALKRYLQHLGQARPAGSDESYLKAIYRMEQQCNRALRALLRPEQAPALERYAAKLGQIPLENDPFAEALRRFRQAARQ